jgi:acyl-CoA synthetase (AMP-forming)/AMP-acid ligase II
MTSPIIDLLLANVRDNAERGAIVDGNRRVSYAELLTLTRKWAAKFAELGIEEGDSVLVFVPPSIDLYAILLSLWWRGAIAVFADAWTTRHRMAHVCAQTQPKIMVTIPKALLLRIMTPALRDLLVELVWSGKRLPLESRSPAPAELTAEHSALVTFTTGSSGAPKGADRTHRFLLAQHRALGDALGDDAAGCDLVTLPIFGLHALAAGRTCVLAPISHSKPSRYDPRRMLDVIGRNRPTSAAASPAVYETLMNYLERIESTVDLPMHLQVGGAAVTPGFARRLHRNFPNAEVRVVYGSTEAEPISILDGRCLASVSLDTGHGRVVAEGTPAGLPAGRPYSGINLQIIAANSTPIGHCSPNAWCEMSLPVGEIGEICVAGDHVLTRYFNNDVADSNQKIRVGGTTWHRTGDAGCLEPDGTLTLYGAVSQSFGWGGQDWYPLPIEMQLDALPGVAKAAIICGDAGPVICVESSGRQIPRDLRRSIRDLALPGDWSLWLGRIPRDPRHNSKIDLGRLQGLVGANS